MANPPSPPTDDPAGSDRDAIRIVPLHPSADTTPNVEAIAAPAAPPRLAYGRGPLLANVEVFTIFWGAAWQSTQAALADSLNAFFDYILTSALVDQLAEYDVPAYAIGHGRRTGTLKLTTPAPGRSITDAAIQHMLTSQIGSNKAFPGPSANTLYFLYLPPGVRVVQGGAASCQAFCGYHNHIARKVFYAVMPSPDCKGCLGALTAFDALTSTSSHELCESITDPIPGSSWYDEVNGEIGDICAWKTKKLGAYTVQLEWSNKRNRCA